MALPYQDKRDDKGHAKIVTNFSIKLCKLEKVDEDIVVPAAILHDIGWSSLSKENRFLPFSPKNTPKKEYVVRIKHQKEGVKLARKILAKAKYPPKFIKPILEIISQHDTRQNFISKEEGVMRDADKLWRYTKLGIKVDRRRKNISFLSVYNKIKKKINEQNFFYSQSAKKIAKIELGKMKKEFLKT